MVEDQDMTSKKAKKSRATCLLFVGWWNREADLIMRKSGGFKSGFRRVQIRIPADWNPDSGGLAERVCPPADCIICFFWRRKEEKVTMSWSLNTLWQWWWDLKIWNMLKLEQTEQNKKEGHPCPLLIRSLVGGRRGSRHCTSHRGCQWIERTILGSEPK